MRGRIEKDPGLDVRTGVEIDLNLNRPAQSRARANFDVLHEDEHILVLNKPAGLLSIASSPEAASSEDTVLRRVRDYAQVRASGSITSEVAHAGLREIVKTLHDAGFSARIETVNALEAYLGSLPGHGYPNIRRALLASANIADLLPATSIWPGLATNPSQYFPDDSPALMWTATDGSTPFRLNVHDSDVGHTLVVGRTGAGKSVLVEALAARRGVVASRVGGIPETIRHGIHGLLVPPGDPPARLLVRWPKLFLP